MNAILLLNQCDSIVTKACGTLIPVVQETYEAGTNSYDVSISDAICKSLVLIVAICIAGFLLWRFIDYAFCYFSEGRKHEWDVEEKDRKQKSNLLDKYLDFLKEQTKEKDYVTIEEYEKQRKEFMKQLLELIKEPKENKQMETENSQLDDKATTTGEEKKESIQYLINVLEKYINSEKARPANIDQVKIDKYRKTLEKLISLSQNDKLKEFTQES